MKSVLISIRQEWCSLIASGQKTIEVRKTKPKLETPFKVYIYCTKSKKKTRIDWVDKALGGGMVIGEFVCDRISRIVIYDGCLVDVVDCEKSCLSPKEILEYSGGDPLYGWHITDLKVYDKPKHLCEFEKYTEHGLRPCELGMECQEEYYDPQENTMACKIDFSGDACPYAKMQRPPQSWCYVEEL